MMNMNIVFDGKLNLENARDVFKPNVIYILLINFDNTLIENLLCHTICLHFSKYSDYL